MSGAPVDIGPVADTIRSEGVRYLFRKLVGDGAGATPDGGTKYHSFEPVSKGEEIKRWGQYVADKDWLTAIGWGIQLRKYRNAKDHGAVKGLREHIQSRDVQSLWIAEALEAGILDLVLDKLVKRGSSRDQIANSLRTFLTHIQRNTKFVQETDDPRTVATNITQILQVLKPEFFGIAGAGIAERMTRNIIRDVYDSPIEYSHVGPVVHDVDIALVFCLEGPGYRPPPRAKPKRKAPSKRRR